MSVEQHFDNLKADVTGKNGDRKRNTVIAIGTVVLVVIAYLTLKHLQNAQSGASNIGTDTSGTTGDTGEPDDQSLAAVANAIGSQTGILDQISKRLKSSNTKLRKSLKVERKTKKQEGHQEAQLKKLREELKKKHTHDGSKKGGTHPHKKSTPVKTGLGAGKGYHHPGKGVYQQGPNPPRKGHGTHPAKHPVHIGAPAGKRHHHGK